MRQLIRTPGGYWTAFFTGFFGTIGAIVGPLVGFFFEARPKLAELPLLIGVMLAASTAAAVVVGVLCVIPRWLYAWAYRRVTER